MPVFAFHLGEFEDDGQTIEGPHKDWLRPAAASMAKLRHLQGSMHNMGFKPPSSAHKLTEQQPQGLTKQNKNGIKSRNLLAKLVDKRMVNHNNMEIRPHSASLLLTQGSASSISQLKARHEKLNMCQSSGLKLQTNPESSLTLKKQQLLGRNSFNAIESHITHSHAGSENVTEPEVPHCSLVSGDEENETSWSKVPKLQHQRLREHIHLSVPNAFVGSDDDEDEFDVHRLSQLADGLMNRNTEEEDCAVKNLEVIRSATSDPTDNFTEYRNTNDIAFQRQTLTTSSKIFHSGVSDACDQNGQNQNRKPFIKSTTNLVSMDRCDLISGDHFASAKPRFDSHSADGSIDDHKENTELISSDITEVHNAEGRGHNRQCGPDIVNNFSELLQISKSRAKPRSGNLLHNNIKIRDDKDITVNVTSRNIERKLLRKSAYKKSLSVQSELESCSGHEDSMCHLELTAGTSGKKYISHVYNGDTLNNSLSCTNDKLNCKQITTVTVDYEDDEDKKELVPNYLRNKSKNDEEIINSELSRVDIDSHTLATVQKSSRNKNFYEIARTNVKTTPAQASLRENIYGPQAKGDEHGIPPLFKTTKTIEFSPHIPQEITSKSVIQSNSRRKQSKDDLNYKQHQRTAHALWHGAGKRKQERPIEKKTISQEEITGLNREEIYENKMDATDTLIRGMYDQETQGKVKAMENVSLLNSIKEQPPSGKKHGTQNIKERLFTPVCTHAKKISANCHPAKDLKGAKSSIKNRVSSAPKERTRPHSSEFRAANFADVSRSRQRVQTEIKDDHTKQSTRCRTLKAKPVPAVAKSRVKSASAATRLLASDLISLKPENKITTLEAGESLAMQAKMAALGVDVGVQALERALYPPSGKSLYYHVAGYLPSDPSFGLIPHYKHWLPEEYEKLQMINKKLEDDDRLRQRRRLCIARQEKKLQGLKDETIRTEGGCSSDAGQNLFS